ncbi:hypothetical protein [Kutzneria buriramensis]|uniref:Uncharacterized protein n=1 Tax=Kutzneria buriramensis TaxID=1045776 RepID=A0A3E0GT81_9PSEU|nr:hypothetical protein [Kutzneria buriramensis]REH25993.1 hypothetical protein BCF44_13532 [Kutzneria buriramensis]
MNRDTITLLRALTAHVDRHDLAESVTGVRISYGEFNISVKDATRGLAATLRRWADSLADTTLTAQPSSSGYDYVHVTLAGHLGDHPITVSWIATDADAEGLRHLLGITRQPTFQLDLDALTGLHTAAAA